MKCPSCGAEARDGSRFCMSCGVDLSASQPGGMDPSEAETVFAPTLKDVAEPAAASLGPSATPEAPTPPPPAEAAAPPTPEPPVEEPSAPEPVADGVAMPDKNSPGYDTFAFPSDLVNEGGPDAIAGYAGDDEDEEPKGSKKKIVIFGCVGCLLLLCCIGIIAAIPTVILPAVGAGSYLGASSADDWENTDWTEWETSSWGKIKITNGSASVYNANNTSATVLETKNQGDQLEYYGFDDTFEFYKVKTAGGEDGYVKLLEAEIAFE